MFSSRNEKKNDPFSWKKYLIWNYGLSEKKKKKEFFPYLYSLTVRSYIGWCPVWETLNMHCLSVVMVSVTIAIQLHGNITWKTSLYTNPDM